MSALELLLRELLGQVSGRAMPSAAVLCEHFTPRARAVTFANANLQHPAWADGSSDSKAAFIELGDEVRGLQVWDDPRGWGSRVEISVESSTRAELERVTGPTRSLPLMPYRPERISADVETTAGRVTISADHSEGRVDRILVMFNVVLSPDRKR